MRPIRVGRSTLPALTSLRFAAAMGVVLFHQRDGFHHLLPPIAQNVLARGYVGVDFFFILSGFILAYRYAGDPVSPRRFWRARVARIYPLYVVGLIVSLPFFLAYYDEDPRWSMGEQAAHGVSAVLMMQAWNPHYPCAWNCPGWSISVEAAFYALFPFVLPLMEKLSRRGLLAALGVCYAARLAAPLHVVSAYSSPLARLPEFLGGIALCLLFLARRGDGSTRLAMPVGAFSVAAILTLWPDAAPVALDVALLPALALAVYGFAGFSRLPILTSRPMVLAGEISFAIYILHTPLLRALRLAAEAVLPDARAPWLLPLYAAALLGASWLAYRAVELPARRWILRERAPPARGDPACARQALHHKG